MPKKTNKGKKRNPSVKKKELLLPNKQKKTFLAVIKERFSSNHYKCIIEDNGEHDVFSRKRTSLQEGAKVLVYISPNDTTDKFLLLYEYNSNDLSHPKLKESNWDFTKNNNELQENIDELDIDDL